MPNIDYSALSEAHKEMLDDLAQIGIMMIMATRLRYAGLVQESERVGSQMTSLVSVFLMSTSVEDTKDFTKAMCKVHGRDTGPWENARFN